MMPRETMTLIEPIFFGMLLGGLFFGGLWLTIRWSLSSSAAAFWLLGSLLLRTSVVLMGFYEVSDGDWQRLAACLAGFVIARYSLLWSLRSGLQPRRRTTDEGPHAP